MTDFLFPKLHKEGYRFLAIAAVIAFILLLSCLLSLCGYFMLKVITKKRFKDFFNQAVPFGPSLACSSILFITYFK